MRAELKTYRQTPRKVRLVTNLIKGKRVDDALVTLSYTPKEARNAIVKLLNSAVANARQNYGVDKKDLYIKKIVVNPGGVLKRIMPRARGSAYQILKRTSHVTLVLETKK